jgi:hypothetical protein
LLPHRHASFISLQRQLTYLICYEHRSALTVVLLDPERAGENVLVVCNRQWLFPRKSCERIIADRIATTGRAAMALISPSSYWDDMTATYTLTNVRIVATLDHEGGAIVETVDRLECYEGRTYQIYGSGTGEGPYTYALEYGLGFSVADAPAPDAAQSSMARIVLCGTHTNGIRVEMRGDGWIGYDNLGNVEGRFDEPPVILAGEEPEIEQSDEDNDDEPFVPVSIEDLKMPQQYMEAMVRHPRSDADMRENNDF